ncbi:MAG: hypothetical protein A2X59_01855 [Nitrospirae bacterium GWC2_42_7]|nr:MAG: hypothetical protein A2X59_01855 [Nitrospirae bacterium GWC2_42_7]
MRRFLILIIAVALVLVAIPAFADTDDSAAMIGDIVFARPIGLASIVVGTGFFVLALPFAAMTGSVDEISEALIVKPAKFTFARPVGNFE